ncbi:ADYC domain-containing protein [Sorangium sp. So ce726]|uniref:ADYC domain-containing protein n=1 Tax=Sorangium sp. So ce726 TaxID=3133319 RepID=UPI003F6363B9
MMALFTGSRVGTRRAVVRGAAGGASSFRRAERVAAVALVGASPLLGAACVGEEPIDELPLAEEVEPLAREAQGGELSLMPNTTSLLPSLKECVTCKKFGTPMSPDDLRQRWPQQGTTLHGIMDGGDCEAVEVPRSFSLSSAVDADGVPIPGVTVRHGRLISSGDVKWTGARFNASLRCADGSGTLSVNAVINEVVSDSRQDEDADPPLLYRVMLIDPLDGTPYPACRDPEDRLYGDLAIPVPGVWNERGNLDDDSDAFTFACVTSAVAKCNVWGYGPAFLGTAGDPVPNHLQEACTRMARADYCGTGVSWTRDGTTIGIWDTKTPLDSQTTATTEEGKFAFEAAWTSVGALCVARPRWEDRAPKCIQAIEPCGSEKEASGLSPSSYLLFNVSASEPDAIERLSTEPVDR